MRRVIQYSILFLLIVCAIPAGATTNYYVRNCDTYGSAATGDLHAADPTCVNGNDTTGDGSIGNPWKTMTKAASMATSTMVGGDVINVSRDSVWSGSFWLVNKTFSIDGTNPLTIQPYTPASCTGACASRRPEFVATSGLPAFQYGSGGGNAVHSGLTIKGIGIYGTRKSGSLSVTAASPTVVTWTGSAFAEGTKLRIYTSNTMPGGITEGDYYVKNVSGASFNLATTSGGTPINASSTGNGVLATTTPNGDIGIYIVNGANYVTIDNVIANDATFGISCEWTQSGLSGSQNYIKIINSTISNNSAEGIALFGDSLHTSPEHSCNHTLVEGNQLRGNGWARNALDHAMYLAAGLDINIRHNTFTDNTSPPGSNSGCTSVILVMHDTIRGVTIERNFFDESAKLSQGGCYHIAASPSSVFDSLRDVVVRYNTHLNPGAIAIQFAGCLRCRATDNSIIWTQNTIDRIGISVTPYLGSPDEPGGQVWVSNNSIYIANANAQTRGIDFSETGAGNRVCSNVVYFDNASNSSATGIKYNSKAASDFDCADYNIVQRDGGSVSFSDMGVNTSGFDVHSQLFTSAEPSGLRLKAVPSSPNWRIEFSSGSAAINAGHPTLSTKFGIGLKAANGARDAGACEYRTGDECSAATTSVADAPVQGAMQ